MAGLISFLRERSLHESLIQKMIEDKIDEDVLVLMEENEMKVYIPIYGDRLAALAYCKSRAKRDDTTDTTENVLSKTMDKLRESIAKRRRGKSPSTPCEMEQKEKQQSGRRKKPTRRVELGWMDFNPQTKSYRHVRSKNGGGIRHLEVQSEFTQEVLLPVAKNLFFPNDLSKRGKVEEFSFCLKDFLMEDMGTRDVAEVYNDTKVKLLRLFMCTNRKDDITNTTEDETTTYQPTAQTAPNNSATNSVIEVDDDDDDDDLPSLCNFPSDDLIAAVDIPSCLTENTNENVLPASSGTPTIQFRHRLQLRRSATNVEAPTASTSLMESNTSSTRVVSQGVVFQEEDLERPTAPVINSELVPEHITTGQTGTHTHFVQDNKSPSNLREIIQMFSENIFLEGKNIINVDRENVIIGGEIGFKRNSFNEWRKMDVKFSGEQGIDDGGPSREFMRLCLRQIQLSPVFQGPFNERLLSLDCQASTKNRYELSGKMMAYSVCHGGPLPNFLAPSLYQQIVNGIDSYTPTYEDIHDSDLKAKISKILHASDEDEFCAAVDAVYDIIQLAGAVRLTLSSQTKSDLTNHLVQFIVIDRKREIFQNFLSGLNLCGLLTQIRKYPQICSEIFLDTKSKLTASDVEELFEVNWSTKGSNRHRDELKMQTHFRNWLLDLEEEGNVDQLLCFVTGLDRIPPLGFDPQPCIFFRHPGDLSPGDHRAGLPSANTCAMRLTLPILHEYEEFASVMSTCVRVLTLFTDQ